MASDPYEQRLDQARLRNVTLLVPVLLATHAITAILEAMLASSGLELPLLRNNLIRMAILPLLAWLWFRSRNSHGLSPMIMVWMALLGFAVSHGAIAANVDTRIGSPVLAGSGWLVVTAVGCFPARGKDAVGLALAVAATYTIAFLGTAPPGSLGPQFFTPLALVLLVSPILSGYAALATHRNLRAAWTPPQRERRPSLREEAPEEEVVSYIHDLLRESDQFATGDGRAPRPAPPSGGKWTQDSQLPVLVVETPLAAQKQTMRLLGQLGYETVAVDHGHDAVEAVLAQRFCIVLMDGPMPGMDGYEATRLIRAVGTENCRVPIVGMLTQTEADENAGRALEAGMDDWIEKPATLESLRASLGRWASDPSAASR